MSESLEPPYLVCIPYAVMVCNEISANAKLFFGCLTSLSKKYGYCWATNEQLAEMYQMSESEIKRFLKELEDSGFIRREVEQAAYQDEMGRVLWTKKRKIFVSDAFSMGAHRSDQNKPDRFKNEPINDRLKNEPYKDKHKEETKNNNSPDLGKTTSVESDSVVVFSCLENIPVKETTKRSVSKKYDEQTVMDAIAFCENELKTKGSFNEGYDQALQWACKERIKVEVGKDPERLRSSNREAVIAKLKSDWGTVKTIHGVTISFKVGHDHVIFMDSTTGSTFDLLSQSCLTLLDKYLKEHYKM